MLRGWGRSHSALIHGIIVVATCLCLLPPERARGEEPADSITYSVPIIGPRGVYAYAPDRWGILHINLVNRKDQPVDLLTLTDFKDDPTLQYGRRVHVPANSQLKTWHPIRLPVVAPGSGNKVPIRTLVMDVTQDREVLIRSESGQLQLETTLQVKGDGPMTGMIDNPTRVAESMEAFDLVTIARMHWHFPRRMSRLSHRILAPGQESLDALDQLVIADGSIIDDGAGLAAIRRWVQGGGHLWVMLDLVDPRLLELLFGDELVCGVVDRVGLTTVRLDLGGKEQWILDHERPVDLVRVVPSNVDVSFTVDGWPAAFWKNIGEGRLLVTTLGSRGWLRRPNSADKLRPDNELAKRDDAEGEPNPDLSAFLLQDPMVKTTQDFFAPRREPLLPTTVLEPLVQEYVGYSIPPRWLVFSLLIGFAALLAGMGVWLSRIGRLEWMGAIGPGMALAVSACLVASGWLQRSAVSPAVARLQFIQIESGTDEVRTEGFAGLYSPEPGMATIESDRGGILMPDMTGLTGTTRRMVWTDVDAWRWENLPETAGLRGASFHETNQTTDRVEVRATFGPEGLIGQLQGGGDHKPTDAIIATSDGRIGVEFQADGSFVARATDVFSKEQFVAARLLSDEQNRRQRVLQRLLADPQRKDYPASPQLLFWTDPWNSGFRFGEGRRSYGAALVAAPLMLDRPAAGTQVRLPAPLLPFRSTPGPDGTVGSSLYDHNTREWLPKTIPAMTWLKFRIPQILMPVEVQRARLTVQVEGPMGKLEIAGHRQSVPASIKTWTSPVGTLTVEIEESDLLSVTRDGEVLLRVSGGDSEQVNPDVITEKLLPWHIESLALELEVKTLALTGVDTAANAGE